MAGQTPCGTYVQKGIVLPTPTPVTEFPASSILGLDTENEIFYMDLKA